MTKQKSYVEEASPATADLRSAGGGAFVRIARLYEIEIRLMERARLGIAESRALLARAGEILRPPPTPAAALQKLRLPLHLPPLRRKVQIHPAKRLVGDKKRRALAFCSLCPAGLRSFTHDRPLPLKNERRLRSFRAQVRSGGDSCRSST
jgi:hypothetical protein